MGLLNEAKAARRETPAGMENAFVKANDGEDLRCLWLKPETEQARGTVLFVPGRTEFAEKFFEDMLVWRGLGYWSAAMDLRGQGLSYRPCPDRDKHYVETFDQHIPDLDCIWDHLERVGAPKPWIMMGHSAGSHCTLRYLHDHGDRIDRAILSAPMAGFYEGGVPVWIIRFLSSLVPALGGARAYVPGYSGYEPGLHGWRKQLTHDLDRFEDEDFFILNQDRDLAVGGVTYGWIRAALRSVDALHASGYPEAIANPVLLLSAGAETIVSNPLQQAIAERMPNCRFETLGGAKHELLKETDVVRGKVWALIADFADIDASLL